MHTKKKNSYEYLIYIGAINFKDVKNFIGSALKVEETWFGDLCHTRILTYKNQIIKIDDVIVKLGENFKIFSWEEFVMLFNRSDKKIKC